MYGLCMMGTQRVACVEAQRSNIEGGSRSGRTEKRKKKNKERHCQKLSCAEAHRSWWSRLRWFTIAGEPGNKGAAKVDMEAAKEGWKLGGEGEVK